MAMGSSSSATVAVDKATSDLLIGPDWTMNMDICDSINSHHWQAKDVVKAVKKRLQHKNPKVQLLALTLLETMVKNCSDYAHFQIAEKNILGEMVKIVKKKTDMHVRDKILVLLDSWQEAFGGPGGKHTQYYWAYEDLRRSGVQFPQRSLDAAPIFTPPVNHPTMRHAQVGYGMPRNSSRTLDETMATEIEDLSLSSLDSMWNIMELLGDMLQAVNPSDCEDVKGEVIVDLVNRCRSNQKKLMQMLTTTGDEELLGRGLELNDSLQILLAKHDAIVSGSFMPSPVSGLSPKTSEGCSSSNIKQTEVRDASPRTAISPATATANVTKSQIDEEEEEEDDFAQLARRHSKTQSSSQNTCGANSSLVSMNTSMPISPNPTQCNALALPDPPAPVRTTEQDMIDLLSITLSTTSTSAHPYSPHTPSNQSMPQTPASSGTQSYPYASHTYTGSQGQVPYNNYVVPWAQSQTQHQLQPPSHSESQPLAQQQLQFPSLSRPQLQPQPQPHSPPQSQQQIQAQHQPQLHSQYPQYSYGYPPPPWAATPGYADSRSHTSATNSMSSTTQTNTTASYTPMQLARPLQHHNSFTARGSNGSTVNGPWMSSGARIPSPPGAQKQFVPSYRLFEDLNVFGNADGRFKMTSSTSPSLSGTSGQGMVGGRK